MSVSSMRLLRQQRVSQGLCCACGKAPLAHGIRCNRCAIRNLRIYRNRNPPTFNMTYAEIGQSLGMTESQVKSVCQIALKKLKRACKREGISFADVIGRPSSMMAQGEMWGEAS